MPIARSLLSAAACACVSLAVAAPARAAEPVRPADAFVDSVGVNIHWTYGDTAYAKRDLLIDKLTELGVRHVRDGLSYNTQYAYDSFNKLASRGIKTTFIMGDPTESRDTLAQLMTTVRTKVPNAVDALEGPNEYSYSGRPAWATELRAYQRRLYAQAKATPGLASLPVLAPSQITWQDHAAVGDLTDALDVGNKHSYPGGDIPEANVTDELSVAARISGSKPVEVTETGYHNGLNSSSGHRPVSEAGTATYMPRLFLEYFRRGIPRTFSYELIDEWPDPNKTNAEANFGLLRNDYSEKPAFTAIKNLLAVLKDPGGGNIATQPLNYSLSGAPSDIRQLVLQKSDGSRYLVLWRAVSVWNRDTKTAITPDTKTIGVTVPGATASDLSVIQPNVSTAAGAPTMANGAVRLALKGDPMILRVAGSASAPAAPDTATAATGAGTTAAAASPVIAPSAPTVTSPVTVKPTSPVTGAPAQSSKPSSGGRAPVGRVRVPRAQRISTVLRSGLVLDCTAATAGACRADLQSENRLVASAGSMLQPGRSGRLRLRLNRTGRRVLRTALRRRRGVTLAVRAQVSGGRSLRLLVTLAR